jgi:hypothetical protein
MEGYMNRRIEHEFDFAGREEVTLLDALAASGGSIL